MCTVGSDVLDPNGPDWNDPALWHSSSGLPACLQFASLLCLTLSTHPAKCLQIYLSLWLCFDHPIKLVHNAQFFAGPAFLEHDNCSCWLDCFHATQGSLFSLDRTRVIPLCSARLWQSHTEPITAEQWCLHRDIKQARYWSRKTQKSINVSHWTPQGKTYFEVQEAVICVRHTSRVCVSAQLAVLAPDHCLHWGFSVNTSLSRFKTFLSICLMENKAMVFFCLDHITFNLLCTFCSI